MATYVTNTSNYSAASTIDNWHNWLWYADKSCDLHTLFKPGKHAVELLIEFLRIVRSVAAAAAAACCCSWQLYCYLCRHLGSCFPFALTRTHTDTRTRTHSLSTLFAQISTSGLFCFLSISARTHSARRCPHKFDTFISIPLCQCVSAPSHMYVCLTVSDACVCVRVWV